MSKNANKTYKPELNQIKLRTSKLLYQFLLLRVIHIKNIYNVEI